MVTRLLTMPSPGCCEDDDLASLPQLDEHVLLNRLQTRYEQGKIYTYVGDILIAINPFKKLGIYTDEYDKQYMNLTHRKFHQPHAFAIADFAYRSLRSSGADQVCVISGESGAGKTETSKLVLQHLLYISRSVHPNLQGQIIKVSPLLEAFGNARTVMNTNSSRFGKFLKLHFNEDGVVTGASLAHYLLEKSRVVYHNAGELNFHIFYLLFAGLNDVSKRRFSLGRPDSHRYLASGGERCTLYDLELDRMEKQFEEVVDCMRVVGFEESDIERVFSCLAAILHIGNLRFTSDNLDHAMLNDTDRLSFLAELLGVDSKKLILALTTQVSVTRGETITRFCNTAQACEYRDSMAKSIYSRLFSWVIKLLNAVLSPEDAVIEVNGQCRQVDNMRFADISILDIFGFENFSDNSFEQFCINVANEQLQFYFNQYIFAWELEEYGSEGITAEKLTNFNSSNEVIELFFAKPVGMFNLLDEESKFHRASAVSLVQKFNQHCTSNSHFQKSRQSARPYFVVNHYAGLVTYNATGFLDKNRNTLPNPIIECLCTSKELLISTLFEDPLTDSGQNSPGNSNVLLSCTLANQSFKFSRVISKRVREVRKSFKQISSDGEAPVSLRQKPSLTGGNSRRFTRRYNTHNIDKAVKLVVRKTPPTVGSAFRSSLIELLEKILVSSPHFVRCIKPNSLFLPDEFDREMVARQLNYAGVLETTRIRRLGFPTRLPFATFMDNYGCLVRSAQKDLNTCSAEECAVVLDSLGIQDYTLGRTKVFLRYHHTEMLFSHLEEQRRKVILVQKLVRGFLARCKVQSVRRNKAVEVFCVGVKSSSLAVSEAVTELAKEDVRRHEERIHRKEESKRQEKGRQWPDGLGNNVKKTLQVQMEKEGSNRGDTSEKVRQASQMAVINELSQVLRDWHCSTDGSDRMNKKGSETSLTPDDLDNISSLRDVFSAAFIKRLIPDGISDLIQEKLDELVKVEEQLNDLKSQAAELDTVRSETLRLKKEVEQQWQLAQQDVLAAERMKIKAHEKLHFVQHVMAEMARRREALQTAKTTFNGSMPLLERRRCTSTLTSRLPVEDVSSRSFDATRTPPVVFSPGAQRAGKACSSPLVKLRSATKHTSSSSRAMDNSNQVPPLPGEESTPVNSGIVRSAIACLQSQGVTTDLLKTGRLLQLQPKLANRSSFNARRNLDECYETPVDSPLSGNDKLLSAPGSQVTLNLAKYRDCDDGSAASSSAVSMCEEIDSDTDRHSISYSCSFSSLSSAGSDIEIDSPLGEEPWALLTVMEGTKENGTFRVVDSEFVIDGSQDMSADRIGLNALPAVSLAPGLDELRKNIGNGVSIRLKLDGTIWMTRLSRSLVYIKSWKSSVRNCLCEEISTLRGCLPRRAPVKVFDIEKFRQNLALEVARDEINQLNLFAMCRIGISFVKDNPEPAKTPCWVILDLIARHNEVSAMLTAFGKQTACGPAPWQKREVLDPSFSGFREAANNLCSEEDTLQSTSNNCLSLDECTLEKLTKPPAQKQGDNSSNWMRLKKHVAESCESIASPGRRKKDNLESGRASAAGLSPPMSPVFRTRRHTICDIDHTPDSNGTLSHSLPAVGLRAARAWSILIAKKK